VKVLVDECVPVKLLRLLKNHDFVSAKDRGWGSFSNGRLLALAESEFEVFLTADTNIRYQQNLSSRKIAIVILSTNHWPTLRRHFALVQNALDKITPQAFVPVEIPHDI
jgi:hypothetical protein